jgi:hypothetical protein
VTKSTLPPLSPAHREFNRRVAIVEDRITKYIIPLYGTNDRRERYVIGTGVLLRIQNDGFLITAAHVLDENRRAQTNIEIPGDGRLVPIDGQTMTTPLPSSGRRDSRFAFFDIALVDPSDTPGPRTRYTFAGYPSSQHNGPRGGTLTIAPLRLTSESLPPDQYPEGFALETHACIAFDPKQAVARSGTVQRPPDPHGVSGGGVFRIGTWDEIIAGTNQERLVGIAIEMRKQEQCLLGTRIAYPLEMIRSERPGLDASIPSSRYLRVNTS